MRDVQGVYSQLLSPVRMTHDTINTVEVIPCLMNNITLAGEHWR